jgi:glc operon protein GlcG
MDEKEATMSSRCFVRFSATLVLALSVLASAFGQMPNPYGSAISLENAKKVAAPALAEAAKNNWAMAVAIVDPSGNLVYYEKMDATQIGSANVAIEKARSAALFKRPTKTYQDALAAGGDGMRVLRLQGAVPIEGGIPILVDGKIAGAIGVSGGTSAQDGQCAKAGADALLK